MSWQDRDYARPGPPRYGGLWGLSPFGGRRPRSIVTTLIAINVGLHLLWAFFPAARPLYAACAMQADKVLHGQVWRLFTAQYLHAFPGMNHVLFNMIGLYFLGRALERVWSPKKFLAVYTLAGLSGNLLYLALSSGGWFGWFSKAGTLVGASGCILGLLGACAVMFPSAEVYVYFLFPVKIRTAAIAFAGLYAFNIWQRGANAGGDAAHLAGLAFGVCWAARGERWWAISGSRAFGRLAGTLGGPKAPRPTSWRRKVQQRQADAELIDKLLAKVYEGGLHCLTPQERKALTDATERARRQEDEAGRVDRL